MCISSYTSEEKCFDWKNLVYVENENGYSEIILKDYAHILNMWIKLMLWGILLMNIPITNRYGIYDLANMDGKML